MAGTVKNRLITGSICVAIAATCAFGVYAGLQQKAEHQRAEAAQESCDRTRVQLCTSVYGDLQRLRGEIKRYQGDLYPLMSASQYGLGASLRYCLDDGEDVSQVLQDLRTATGPSADRILERLSDRLTAHYQLK